MGRIVNVSYPITKVGSVTVNTSKKCNISQYDAFSSREIKYIVMHYTGNYEDSAVGNANYFMGANRNASAHYFVDDDSIWQSVGLKDAAWHAGAWDAKSFAYHPECRNMNSIGIEMCCTAGNYDMSAQTVELSAQLCAALCKYLNITDVDKYVVRHYDVSHKECPRPMVRNTARWNAFRARVKEILNVSPSQPVQPTKTEVKETCTVELPILRKGAESGYVCTLQILLNKYNNARLEEDGIFGNGTYNAVVAYQRSRGLDVDGIVGAQTWTQLLK